MSALINMLGLGYLPGEVTTRKGETKEILAGLQFANVPAPNAAGIIGPLTIASRDLRKAVGAELVFSSTRSTRTETEIAAHYDKMLEGLAPGLSLLVPKLEFTITAAVPATKSKPAVPAEIFKPTNEEFAKATLAAFEAWKPKGRRDSKTTALNSFAVIPAAIIAGGGPEFDRAVADFKKDARAWADLCESATTSEIRSHLMNLAANNGVKDGKVMLKPE